MDPSRHTFVLTVRGPEQLPVLEDTATRESVAIELAEVAPQIERWLNAGDAATDPALKAEEPS